jgi:Pectate lyase superfamily protein
MPVLPQPRARILALLLPIGLGSHMFVAWAVAPPTGEDQGPPATYLPNTIVVDAGADSAAIQRAIDGVTTLDAGGGPGHGTVILPRGHYDITTPINLRSGVRLVGAGAHGDATTADGGTVLVFAPDTNTEWDYALRIGDPSRGDCGTLTRFCQVRGLKIIASPKNTNWEGGILLSRAWDCLIEQVAVTGFLDRDNAQLLESNHTPFDDLIDLPGEHGIGIHLTNGSFYNSLRGAKISNCNALVAVTDAACGVASNGNSIVSCELSGTCNSAIYVRGSGDNRFMANLLEVNMTFAQFELVASNSNSILANSFELMDPALYAPGDEWHISLAASTNNMVFGNQLVEDETGSPARLDISAVLGTSESHRVTVAATPTAEPILPGTEGVRLRIPIPPDRQPGTPMALDVFWTRGRGTVPVPQPRGGGVWVEFEAEVSAYADGDQDLVGESFAGLGLQDLFGSGEGDHFQFTFTPNINLDGKSYIEVRLKRGSALDTYLGYTQIEQIQARYSATETEFSRESQ